MNYTIALTLCLEHFKRRFGIHRNTFKQMVKTLKPLWRPIPKLGAKPKSVIEDRPLEYWQEYHTQTSTPIPKAGLLA